jgi:Family of unknown function (DUF6503)
MKPIHFIALASLCCSLPIVAAENPNTREIADAVIRASGGDHWGKVKSLRFTFNVSQDGKTLMSATHNWDVRGGTDAVSWSGKTVQVDLKNPSADADSKAAYHRWVNDSYWLLAPLKLNDSGVTLAYQGTQEVDGKSYDVLHLSFAGVGLTPGDQYNFYIDPETHLVRRWDYMPNPAKKVSGTWDEYEEFGGLKLSTDHQFGGKRIWFSDVHVEAD